jgi:SAM-dependent methyltransferase
MTTSASKAYNPLSSYVFDNSDEGPTRRRFIGLPLVFDPGTIRHLLATGVGPGWQCLEVGAGGGSVALWLAQHVGMTGSVLATDIDTRFLDWIQIANLEVRRHDIGTDPLPEHAFDLVHARLVLQHVPARDAALARLAASLKQGGWLVIEDFDSRPGIRSEPDLDPTEVPLKTSATLTRLMAANGVDLAYARCLPARMRALGLVDIEAEGRTYRWAGGSPGASIVQAGLEQLRGPILDTGEVNQTDYDADVALLEDPNVAFPSPTLWAVWGRAPVTPAFFFKPEAIDPETRTFNARRWDSRPAARRYALHVLTLDRRGQSG